jgi:hypothetical protein
MKWMRWVLVLAVGAAIALGAGGCSDSDRGGDPIVGIWRMQTFNGQPMPDDPMLLSLVITFRDDGTFDRTLIDQGDVLDDGGTWSVDNGVLTIISDVSGQVTDRGPYTISGDTLTFTDSETGNVV